MVSLTNEEIKDKQLQTLMDVAKDVMNNHEVNSLVVIKEKDVTNDFRGKGVSEVYEVSVLPMLITSDDRNLYPLPALN